MRLCVVLLALGCSSSTEPDVAGDPEVFLAKWEAFGIRSYDYDLTSWSEWFGPATVRVSVRNGVVTDAVDGEGNHDADRGRTMEQLFATAIEMRNTARDNADTELVLRFDWSYGFVRVARIDIARYADDAYGYSVANLTIR